jgi:hypothetical protein
VILERLLLDFPETTVTVLVRSQTSATAVERVHYLTRKPAFDVLRSRLGGDDQHLALLDDRVTVIDGDFTRRARSRCLWTMDATTHRVEDARRKHLSP